MNPLGESVAESVAASVAAEFLDQAGVESPSQLMEGIKRALNENGISIPFPQMDVHLVRETEIQK